MAIALITDGMVDITTGQTDTFTDIRLFMHQDIAIGKDIIILLFG